MKNSLKFTFACFFIANLTCLVAHAESFAPPKVKIPASTPTGKVETRKADWEELNDTKLSDDTESTVRQLASDPEEVPEDPKDRGPSSNGENLQKQKDALPAVDVDNSEKYKFWKFDRNNSRKAD